MQPMTKIGSTESRADDTNQALYKFNRTILAKAVCKSCINLKLSTRITEETRIYYQDNVQLNIVWLGMADYMAIDMHNSFWES